MKQYLIFFVLGTKIINNQKIVNHIQVTKNGDFAIPLNSANKCIHENLVIGRFTANSKFTPGQLENNKVIVSVPSLVHSHKPPLTGKKLNDIN